MKKILFVCLGNIVRSPLAESIFNQMAIHGGVSEKYFVDSAGTGDWHVGEPPDPRMRRVAARHGLIYDHRGRHIQKNDFDAFDLLVAMDRENRSALMQMSKTTSHQEKIHLLREFDLLGGVNASVPDPYYGGIDGFEEVYAIIERSVRSLLDALEAGMLDVKPES